eukprot:1461105-Ditylum_brightwellii.AAC.1
MLEADDADRDGIPDIDILIALNIEAYCGMNAYAHAFSPTGNSNVEQLPVHPLVTKVYEAIHASASKMEHFVLDHVATACARLGGGSTIFCKYDKDRTAIQVTFKAAQYINQYMEGGLTQSNETMSSSIMTSKIYADVALMRIHGTRLPICDKNVGQSKYAFNLLQSKFMPDALKPPP